MHQNIFLNEISRYFNTGALSRFDKLCSILFPGFPFRKNAGYIQKSYGLYTSAPVSSSQELFNIEPYSGNDSAAIAIADYLQKNLAAELVCAVVHGSIATEEKINYSDFDGLVIIKNDVFKSTEKIQKVAEHLSKTYSLMINDDPLQHHGWFVMTEKELNNWPSWRFPPVIFNYSKSLLAIPVELKIKSVDVPELCRAGLSHVIASVIKTLQNGFPANAYQLKSLFSEFMLLPTLFLHAKFGKGIYKKFSFTEAKKYFDENSWKSMDEVSSIRREWEINQGIIFKSVPLIITPSIKKRQVSESAKVPEYIRHRLDDNLKTGMIFLVNQFEKAAL